MTSCAARYAWAVYKETLFRWVSGQIKDITVQDNILQVHAIMLILLRFRYYCLVLGSNDTTVVWLSIAFQQ